MSYLLECVFLLFQIYLLWLSADFFTGIVHWWQDAYGNPRWPIIGKYVIEPNLRHHRDPRAMVKLSYWSRVSTSIYAAILISILLWVFNLYSWQIVVFLIFSSQGNEIHAMSHRTDRENGKLVIYLQRLGVIQKRRTHGWHHKAPYDTNFCVMTEFLNPLLNRINFWMKTEWVIAKVFKIKPLRGSSLRNGL